MATAARSDLPIRTAYRAGPTAFAPSVPEVSDAERVGSLARAYWGEVSERSASGFADSQGFFVEPLAPWYGAIQAGWARGNRLNYAPELGDQSATEVAAAEPGNWQAQLASLVNTGDLVLLAAGLGLAIAAFGD